jgi:mono/diheme cytochrome c family protein
MSDESPPPSGAGAPLPIGVPSQRVRSDAANVGPEVEPDVERLHRPIFRELRDPVEGREPVPWWMSTAVVLATFWGGWYLGRYGGTFDAQAHTGFRGQDMQAGAAASRARTTLAADPVSAGQAVYTQRCQACHQATGMGLPGAFPPVRGSEWETGAPEQTIRIIMDGLQGPVIVAGKTFSGAMPPWRDQLSNAEIAAVATYVRQWKPNNAPPVDTTLVVQVRTATAGHAGKPWTAGELQSAAAAARTSTADTSSR